MCLDVSSGYFEQLIKLCKVIAWFIIIHLSGFKHPISFQNFILEKKSFKQKLLNLFRTIKISKSYLKF